MTLRALSLISWCVAQFTVRPRPTLRELIETLRHPDPEPFS